MPEISELIRLAREAEHSKVGYDQGQRWTWLDRAGRRIVPDKETDCSALTLGLYWLAGWPVDISGTCWTGNAEKLCRDAGFTVIDISEWDTRRLRRDPIAGDALVGPGHIILVGDDGTWLSAEFDERGKASGGAPGDQSGREVRWREPYARSSGWKRLLRPPTGGAPVQLLAEAKGPELLIVDGELGRYTVSEWQKAVGVAVTGGIDQPKSPLVEAVQRDLVAGGHGDWDGRALTIDGEGIAHNLGRNWPTRGKAYPSGRSRTLWALQLSLGVEPTGRLIAESPTVMALQKRLNARISGGPM